MMVQASFLYTGCDETTTPQALDVFVLLFV